MRAIIFLTATLLASFAYAGDNLKEVKARVGNDEILRNWNVGETKIMNGISILRVSGENQVQGRTNLLYSRADSTVNGELVSTGYIYLFLDRESEEAADGKWMNIAIGSAENLFIFEKQVESIEPRPYRYGIWYNFLVITVNETLPEKFTVTVTDGFDGRVYEFRITQPKSISKPSLSKT